MAEERPRTFRWTMLVRLLAVMLVQAAIGRWLLTVWFLTEKGYLSAQWFSTLDGLTVVLAAVVADICLCTIILSLHRGNLLMVCIEVVSAFAGGIVFILLMRASRPGEPDLYLFSAFVAAGWFVGCLLSTRLRANASTLEKPKLQFTLREIFIAMLIAAIGAWLISWAI